MGTFASATCRYIGVAGVAQLAEQCSCKALVVSSNLTISFAVRKGGGTMVYLKQWMAAVQTFVDAANGIFGALEVNNDLQDERITALANRLTRIERLMEQCDKERD